MLQCVGLKGLARLKEPMMDADLKLLRQSVRKFLEAELAPIALAIDEEGRFPVDVYRKFCQAGFGAPILPEAYGGADDLMAQVVIAEELGRISPGFGLSVGASVILFGRNVARVGTDSQKAKYLPGIISGDKLGCWGLTEPTHGSDAVSIRTRARQTDGGWILNGQKTFITNAPIADYFIVLARIEGTEGFGSGIAFILERGMKGLATGKPFKKMGHRCSPTGEIFLEDCFVPDEQVLGVPGKAFLDMKHSLDVERVTFSGLGVGLMERAIELAVRYAAQRKQFGVPILEHQLIQDKVARMAATHDMLRLYQNDTAQKIINGQSVTKEAAVLKLLGATACMEGASEAVQIMGGYGYMSEYTVEMLMRDAKLFEIGGGTSEIQKLIIAKAVAKEVLGV